MNELSVSRRRKTHFVDAVDDEMDKCTLYTLNATPSRDRSNTLRRRRSHANDNDEIMATDLIEKGREKERRTASERERWRVDNDVGGRTATDSFRSFLCLLFIFGIPKFGA